MTLNPPLRWGILGGAKIARTSVAPAIHSAIDNQLVALATTNESKKRGFISQYHGLTVHGSYEDLLSDDNVDAVYIPLPNDMHVPWTLKALKAGKHVLCEKPISLEAPQIDQLIAERDRTGRLAAEAFMVVHHPQWERVRELIAEGCIGNLTHVSGSFTYNNSSDPSNIRQKPEHGGGALYDIGVYPVVATRFVTRAEPTDVRAQLSYENGVDTTARVQLDFADFSLDFYCSMRMAGRQDMVFHGTDGWIRLEAPFNAGTYGDALVEIRSGQDRRIERFVRANQYQLMVEAFQRTVTDSEPFSCPLEFSRANQEVIDRIRNTK